MITDEMNQSAEEIVERWKSYKYLASEDELTNANVLAKHGFIRKVKCMKVNDMTASSKLVRHIAAKVAVTLMLKNHVNMSILNFINCKYLIIKNMKLTSSDMKDLCNCLQQGVEVLWLCRGVDLDIDELRMMHDLQLVLWIVRPLVVVEPLALA